MRAALVGRSEEGVTAIEYAFIASLIALVIVSFVAATGRSVGSVFANVAASL